MCIHIHLEYVCKYKYSKYYTKKTNVYVSLSNTFIHCTSFLPYESCCPFHFGSYFHCNSRVEMFKGRKSWTHFFVSKIRAGESSLNWVMRPRGRCLTSAIELTSLAVSLFQAPAKEASAGPSGRGTAASPAQSALARSPVLWELTSPRLRESPVRAAAGPSLRPSQGTRE